MIGVFCPAGRPAGAGELDAVHQRHVEVGDHEIRLELVEGRQTLLAVLSGGHFMAGIAQRQAEQAEQGLGIVDGQDLHPYHSRTRALRAGSNPIACRDLRHSSEAALRVTESPRAPWR
jgi:hypothetical protein